ncbi:hypothetical protein GBAR_LOCUS14308 [Geodia barretti]|uniref:Uncharacterized protein n=1 Tax=Geodia barretti TaxID=519541 RepID=A0AA35WKC1_GEOBA|nr:hypothetical protein GBAR_LOCUS14308 [Geodia barretti]
MHQLLTRVLLCACALALFCQCMTEGDGDGCTRGFMSLDRMDRLLDNIGTRVVAGNFQVIYPEVGFTCNGNIQSWVFGAQWEGGESFFTELQIWRPTGNGFYTKVGYTTIITARNNSELYAYPVSPPLPFQAGDVLGYYQPQPSASQLRLLFVQDRRENQVGYLYPTTGPANSLNISSGFRPSRNYELFVNVVTDPPGCGRGFMSVEKMRLSLNLDSVSPIMYTSQRQQISPEMRFTCDGNITKWIVGAGYGAADNLYPELQIWRKAGDETYEKISGTFIQAPTLVNTRIYEYEDFPPIPVKSGDILGIFIPRRMSSRLRLLSENTTSPTQYYQFTDGSATVSPHNVFEIGNQSVITASYHPLVSVEFVTSPTSSVMILPSSIIRCQSTVESASTLTGSCVPSSALTIATPTKSTAATESGTTGSEVYIFVGVSVGVVVLLAAGLIIISVTVCLRQRSKKKLLINTENVARGMGLELKDNVAYTSTATGGGTKDDAGNYDYVSRDEVTATSSDLSMSANQAYGLVQS